MANKFYFKDRTREALYLYVNARKFSSTNELKRDLSSNISLMLLKLDDCGNAIKEAEICIEYDKSWYKVPLAFWKNYFYL